MIKLITLTAYFKWIVGGRRMSESWLIGDPWIFNTDKGPIDIPRA